MKPEPLVFKPPYMNRAEWRDAQRIIAKGKADNANQVRRAAGGKERQA